MRDIGTRISIAAFALILGIVLWPQYQDWSKRHDAEKHEREQDEQLADVGTDATIAGERMSALGLSQSQG